ncbi:hypothetical protein BD413DRAFT_79614 [Trametes elegans]|nr:hypothetical protein BD413DRAFT_79614 [Trametes elegans]
MFGPEWNEKFVPPSQPPGPRGYISHRVCRAVHNSSPSLLHPHLCRCPACEPSPTWRTQGKPLSLRFPSFDSPLDTPWPRLTALIPHANGGCGAAYGYPRHGLRRFRTAEPSRQRAEWSRSHPPHFSARSVTTLGSKQRGRKAPAQRRFGEGRVDDNRGQSHSEAPGSDGK